MVHSQNVLGPLMIATHYKLGELRTRPRGHASRGSIQAFVDAFFAEGPVRDDDEDVRNERPSNRDAGP